jgi:H+-translocating NAD(P) transhydrogenase subunit beta
MPGYMDVLLAEADVPYPQLTELEEIQSRVPAGRCRAGDRRQRRDQLGGPPTGNAISGMSILDVDKAKSVVVKRSIGHGYVGIDNELYSNPNTSMLVTDAKKGLTDLIATSAPSSPDF